MKRIILLFVIFLISGVFTKSIYAQEGVALSISPPLLEINAIPPAQPQAKILIQNKSENKETINISLRPFSFSPENNGQIELLSEDDAAGPDHLMLKKIRILNNEKLISSLELAPFESQEITLDIPIEEDSPIGDYYFSVIFTSNPISTPQTSSSFITGGIGTNVILSVGRNEQAEGGILNFSVPILNTSGPVPITLLVKNNSQHYIKPTGLVTIKNMFGNTVAEISILPQYVPSGSQRYLTDPEQVMRKGIIFHHPVLVLSDDFLLGVYTAEVKLKLAEQGALFTTEIMFFAIPLKQILIISSIVFVLLGIYVKVRRRN